MANATVKMSLHISSELNEKLENLCTEFNASKSDILRKAIFLMDVLADSRKRGNKLVVVDKNDKKISEIIGV